MEPNQPRRRSLVFPALLVGVGLYLLAHNFGWIETSPWAALATIWPLFLVAIGLDMLLGRARAWVALIVAGLFTLVCLFLFHSDAFVHRAFREGPAKEKAFEVSLKGAPAGMVDLDLDLGELNLAALPEGSPLLAAGSVVMDSIGRLEVKDTAGDAGTTVTVRMDRRRHGPHIDLPGFTKEREMNLSLSRSVPLELKLYLNAGSGNLDLSALQVRRLEADLNAGTATVQLSNGIAAGTADLEVNVGALELQVPAGCAGRLKMDSNMSTVEVDADRFPAGDGGYQSADWETAACKWDVSIRGNLATLTVK